MLNVLLALIILLFTYTAFSKILDHDVFVGQLKVSPLKPIKAFAGVLAMAIPIIELIMVFGLLTDRFRYYTLYAVGILFVLFEIYIGGLMISGLRLPCSCGGVISLMSWKQHLIFNLAFIVITIAAISLIKKERAISTSVFHKNLSRA